DDQPARRAAVWPAGSHGRSDCFFQAEDGIRGGHVTGVETCALPLSQPVEQSAVAARGVQLGLAAPGRSGRLLDRLRAGWREGGQIGRAAGRERVEGGVVSVSGEESERRAVCSWAEVW